MQPRISKTAAGYI